MKLDRSLALRASNDPKARQILNGIVGLLHQSGCLVLLEGVETHDQAMIAIDAGVDFVQGSISAIRGWNWKGSMAK